MRVEGVTVGDGQSALTFPAGTQFRPLRDKIVIKVADWRPSKTIEVAGHHRKPERGCVVAVGPGTYPWIYNSDRSKRRESKAFRPTDVKVGDDVQIEPNRPHIWFLVDNELHVICREEDVAGICA